MAIEHTGTGRHDAMTHSPALPHTTPAARAISSVPAATPTPPKTGATRSPAGVSRSSAPSRPILLRDHAAWVCHSDPGLVVTARADGRYSLNFGTFDSARLVQTLNTILPPRPDRLVVVRTDSGRETALPWVVPAIVRAGGAAYKFDPACLHPVSVADRFFR